MEHSAPLWNQHFSQHTLQMASYAIIKTGGKQYRVTEGDKVDVEFLDLAEGDSTTLSEVLLVNDGSEISFGTPFIEGATVTAEVISQHRAKKVVAFKFRRRKGYHKTRGHRRQLTRLAIKSISL